MAEDKGHSISRRDFVKATGAGALAAGLGVNISGPGRTAARGEIQESRAQGERQDRLIIRDLRAPEVVAAGATFDLLVAVSDSVGVQEVEVLFQGRVERLPAGGAMEALVTAELPAGAAGYHQLEAEAVGVDGARGERVGMLVAVGDHTSEEPAESREEVAELIAAWTAAGGDRFALYERGPIYARGLPTRALEERARATRTQDLRRDQLQVAGDFLPEINWWHSWHSFGGPQPFDWKTFCGPNTPGVTPTGEVLECWLQMHPLVRATMIWQIPDTTTGEVTLVPYDDWPLLMKAVLKGLFYSYWTWLDGGLGNFPDVELATPPVNQVQLQDGQSAVTRFSSFDALSLYLQTVAHSLALEIGGFVPWSFLNYALGDVARLLSSTYLFHFGKYENTNVENPTPVVFTGWRPYGDTTHAPPTKTFRWLVEMNVLRPTHYDTIARLLKWGRENMLHYGGFSTADNAFNHWQYRGDPPVARMLDLTPRLDPPGGPAAWAAGCHGVAFFMQSLLRAANIPVSTPPLANPDLEAFHRSPVFHTAGQALSHGDDVYAVKFNIPSVDPGYLPPAALFVPWATFAQWFPGSAEAQSANVGRQVREIALDILPNKLMEIHCEDLKAFKTHAESGVYSVFDSNYTVAQLETMGLWTRLADKEAKFDFCDEPTIQFPPGPPIPFPNR